jgi:hypothetical protein
VLHDTLARGRPRDVARNTARAGRSRWLELLVATVALVLVFVGLYRSYPHEWNGKPSFVSPRQQVTYELSKRWADTGRPALVEPLLTELPPDIAAAVTPRDAASVDDEIVPKDFPLTVALFAVTHAVASRLVPFVNPALACFSLLLFALIVDRVTGSRRAAWIAAVLLATTTSFWMSSSAIVSGDALGMIGMFVGVFALLRLAEGARSAWALAAGAGFATLIASRYTLAGPAVVLLAVFAWQHRDVRTRLWLALGSMVIGLLPIVAYHDWLYGGPTETGYGIADEVFKERVRFEGRGLTTVNFGRLGDHLRYYLARPEIAALWLAAAIALIVVLTARPRGALRTLAIATPLVSVPIVVYHGGQGLWGSVGFTTNSSFLRYLLPVFALWCLLAAWLVEQIARRPSPVWRDRALALVALVAAAGAWTTYDAAGGVRSLRAGVPLQDFLTQVVLDRTPPDALIISRTGSKVLWPERTVLSATLLYDGPTITDDKVLIWDVVPSAERVADVSASLVEAGHDVYVYDDGTAPGWLTEADIAEIRDSLRARGMRLRATVRSEVPPLYHVVPAA